MTPMPATYDEYRLALRTLVNEAWSFYGLTQVYRTSVYPIPDAYMFVKKNRRWVEFSITDAVVDPYRDAWDYFQAERLLTADTKWCEAFARKLDNLNKAVSR